MAEGYELVKRIRAAINAHDVDALAGCFAEDVVSRQPAHPERDFTGRAQVHANWSQILGGVPDLQATLVRHAEAGDTVWAEWSWTGNRRDGAAYAMAGVTVLGVRDGEAATVTFYMEPVVRASGDVKTAISSMVAPA